MRPWLSHTHIIALGCDSCRMLSVVCCTCRVSPPALQALIAAANGVVSSIAERIGPIHINPAEQGLLETIWLLLTSIICVPAVCKFIPGGSPVLGYLVRLNSAMRVQGASSIPALPSSSDRGGDEPAAAAHCECSNSSVTCQLPGRV